jgi:hypothetical protein
MNLLRLTILLILFSSCQESIREADIKLSLMEKRIKQYIVVSSWGMIKEVKIDSLYKINDSTCFARHNFFNPVFNQEVRVSTEYKFNIGIDSVTSKQQLITEVKAEGEWKKMDF